MANPALSVPVLKPESADNADDAELQEQKPKKRKLTKKEKEEKKRQHKIKAKSEKIRQEFQIELEVSRKSAKKLALEWTDIADDMKLTEMREEITAWQEKTMSKLNDKDEHINDMLIYMKTIDEMNDTVHGQFIAYFDYIQDVFMALTNSSKQIYENSAYEITYDFHNELNEARDRKKESRLHCENIMNTTNVIFDNILYTDYKIFRDHRDSFVNTQIAKRYACRDEVVKKMKALRQQFVTFFQELTATPLNPKKYENIRKATIRQSILDKVYTKLTNTHAEQKRECEQLKLELLKEEISNEKKINGLIQKQSYFRQIFDLINDSLQRDRDELFEKLKIVTSESYLVSKHFKKMVHYGEMLLSTAACVRRYQTEAEKILVWADFPPTEEGVMPSEFEDLRKFTLSINDPRRLMGLTDKQFFDQVNSMRIFNYRLHIALTQKEMLEQEKKQLLAENKKYTDILRSLGTKATKSPNEPKAMIVYPITKA